MADERTEQRRAEEGEIRRMEEELKSESEQADAQRSADEDEIRKIERETSE